MILDDRWLEFKDSLTDYVLTETLYLILQYRHHHLPARRNQFVHTIPVLVDNEIGTSSVSYSTFFRTPHRSSSEVMKLPYCTAPVSCVLTVHNIHILCM